MARGPVPCLIFTVSVLGWSTDSVGISRLLMLEAYCCLRAVLDLLAGDDRGLAIDWAKGPLSPLWQAAASHDHLLAQRLSNGGAQA